MLDSQKPRIFKYDNVRLLAIVLVVIGSFAGEFTARSDMFRSWFIFVSSFNAPLFIFLSGLFTKEFKDGVKPDNYRLSFYFGLGLVLKVIIYLMRRWNGDDVHIDFFRGDTMEWYLFVIVMYAVTMYVLRRVNMYVVMGLSLVLGTLAGFAPIGDELYLMRYFVFLPFYAAGYYLTPAKVRRFSHRTNVKLAGIGFMMLYFIICFRLRDSMYPLRELFIGNVRYAGVPIDGCTFYHRLLCYGISTVLVISVVAMMPNRKFPVLTKMGRNTLGVYFWHVPIVLLLWHFGILSITRLKMLGDPLWKYVVLSAAVVVALALSLSVFSWPFRWMLGKVRTMPPLACMTMDIVIVMGAVVGNLIVE